MAKLLYRIKSCLPIISLLFIVFGWHPASGSITFEEVTKQAGISKHSPTAGAAWGDFNGDGKLDLAVSLSHNTILILPGNRDGTFKTGDEISVG